MPMRSGGTEQDRLFDLLPTDVKQVLQNLYPHAAAVCEENDRLTVVVEDYNYTKSTQDALYEAGFIYWPGSNKFYLGGSGWVWTETTAQRAVRCRFSRFVDI